MNGRQAAPAGKYMSAVAMRGSGVPGGRGPLQVHSPAAYVSAVAHT